MIIYVTFILSSAHDFNLDKVNFLSSGNGLTVIFGLYSFCSLRLLSIWRYLKYYHLVNPFPNKPWFLRVCSIGLLKTLWEKEKLLVTSNFSFSHSVFYLFGELNAIFSKFEIVVCKLFKFGRV